MYFITPIHFSDDILRNGLFWFLEIAPYDLSLLKMKLLIMK